MTDREDEDRMRESSKPPDYERFEQLTRRLLKVPKADLDEQRERHRDGGTSTTTWRTG